MELEVDGFHIIPELSGEEIVPRENYRVSDHPFDSDIQYSSSQCGGSLQCLEMHSFSDTLLNAFLRWCCISLFLYVLLLIEYFIIYKRKKDPSPIKHAFKSTWLWLVVLLVILLLVLAAFYYIFNR